MFLNIIVENSRSSNSLGLDRCHARIVRNSSAPNPGITTNKQPRGEINGMLRCDLFNSPPLNSILFCCTRPSVIILTVKQSLESKIALPWKPPFRLDQVVDLALHDDGS